MAGFRRFAWVVLGYHLAVVAWGAFVRATGSGAGCGRHWPTCNGEVVPRAPALETLVEFLHRATSGLALVLVVALVLWARRALPPAHPGRKAAWASLAFLAAEALLGAALVLFGWVAKDASPARGWVMAAHLANTFLLLASLSLAAAWAAPRPGGLALRSHPRLAAAFAAGLAAMLLAGVTGAVAALGDTLFPATTFAEGLRSELHSEAHLLLRLRVLHPFAALAAGAVLLALARAAIRARPGERVRRTARALAALVVAQLGGGFLNLLLLAPVPMQLVHLALADLLWIALVLLGAEALAPGKAEVPAPEPPAVAAVGRGG